MVALLSASLTATTAMAHETNQRDPADPFATVPREHYHPVIDDYRATAIMTKPSDWRELNDRAERIGGPRGQLRSVDEPIRKRKKN
ncbi:MAG: hypothetical protein HKN60_00305 [Rhizobiales bacterium]|nr:hypothetical protein [Hyphomicrobiales bacterium]